MILPFALLPHGYCYAPGLIACLHGFIAFVLLVSLPYALSPVLWLLVSMPCCWFHCPCAVGFTTLCLIALSPLLWLLVLLPGDIQPHAIVLRNIIERCFGDLKTRFPILKRMTLYTLKTQVSVGVTVVTVHNYKRQKAERDWLFEKYGSDEDYHWQRWWRWREWTLSRFMPLT